MTSRQRSKASKVGWKPRPIPVREPAEIGSVYHWSDAFRTLYYAYFSGPRAHLRDLCDFTPRSPFFGCRCVTVTNESGNEERKWTYGMNSGHGGRTAYAAKDIEKAPFGRYGEPVDELGVEWLEQVDELIRLIIEHEGLRKYAQHWNEVGHVPLSLFPVENPETHISEEQDRRNLRNALFGGIVGFDTTPEGGSEPVTLARINLYIPSTDVEDAGAEFESKSYTPREGGWRDIVIEALGKTCRQPGDVTMEKVVLLLERAGIVMQITGETRKDKKVNLRYPDGATIAEGIALKTFENLVTKIRGGSIPLG